MRFRPRAPRRPSSVRFRSFALSITFLALLAAAAPASAADADLERRVGERLGLSRLTLQHLDVPAAPERFALDLDLGGERVRVQLRRSTLRSERFRVQVQDPDGSLREVTPPAATTYRGTIEGRPGTIVAATVAGRSVTATVAMHEGAVYQVEPIDDGEEGAAGLHVAYEAADAAPGDEGCTVDEPAAPMGPRAEPEGSAAATLKVADIAFDADYEYFLLNHSSVDSTVRDIESVLNAVNAIYERDAGVTHRLVNVVVRATSADPYTSSAADTMLRELRDHWNYNRSGVDRDVVHLMTGKDLTGSTVGLAYVGVVCDRSRAYGLSQSRYSASAPFSRRATLTAHELGHNWNATHCNQSPTVTTPCNIMCSSIGGCDGIGSPNFELQGAAVISAWAAGAGCLALPPLDVVPGPAAAGIRLGAPQPSPFSERTRLSFYLERAGAVRLGIYNVAGQRVATLVEAIQGPGWHTIGWDGRGAVGTPVESGILYVRLESGPERVTGKLIRLR